MESKKRKGSDGYISVKCLHPFSDKDGYVKEHRLVVEKKIDRYLTAEEKIHHIDFNKQNNRIENLMLFPNQKEHMKFHLKLKQFGLTNNMARQILNRWQDFEN